MRRVWSGRAGKTGRRPVAAALEPALRAVEIVLGLVALAVAVAAVADRLKAPAPSLLVVVGLAVGMLPGVPPVSVSPEIVSLVVLPPLLFAAATDLALPDLRAVLRPVLALAVGLVAVSAFVVALVVRLVLPPVPFSAALVLGAVLASTDPVAVTALARRLSLPPRLRTLVQAESLFNDATSLVLFRVAVTASVAGAAVGPLDVAGQLVWLGAGGALAGLVVALLVEQLRRRTEDAVLETLMALVTPYVAFVVAELVHASGVTAVVVAGLWLGGRSVRLSSGRVRLQVDHVYAVVVFLLESVVFAVIGLQFPGLVAELPPGDRGFVLVAFAVTAALLAARVAFLAPLAWLSRGGSPRDGVRRPAPWRAAAVVWWAGARGVVPLAAALSIPVTVGDGRPFPERDVLLVLATSSIILTLVVQGFTLGPLVRRLGVVEDPERASREEALARHAVAVAARARLRELLDLDAAPSAVDEALLRSLDQRVERTKSPDEPTGGDHRALRRDLLAVQTAELLRLRDAGLIGEDVRRRVQRAVDIEEAGLADEER